MKDLPKPQAAILPQRAAPLLLVLALFPGAPLEGGPLGTPHAMAAIAAETRSPSATAANNLVMSATTPAQPQTLAATTLATAGAAIASSPVSASSGTSPATASGIRAPTMLAQAATLSGDELPPNADALMRTPRFRGLAAELRCLVCQNQNLLDSHSPLAADLRHEVVRLMSQGMDDAQVKQYLVDRYGEFVLYRPTWSWRNALLWAGPALMLMIGGFMLWRVFAHRPAPAAASGTDFGSGAGHGSGRGSGSGAGSTSNANASSGPGSRPGSGFKADSDSGGASVSSDEVPVKAFSEAEALAKVDALLAEDDAPRTRPR